MTILIIVLLVLFVIFNIAVWIYFIMLFYKFINTENPSIETPETPETPETLKTEIIKNPSLKTFEEYREEIFNKERKYNPDEIKSVFDSVFQNQEEDIK